MSIQVDATLIHCTFCKISAKDSLLVRGMHGLYCSNEHCFSRETSGNLVPPIACEKCGENSFYLEKDGTLESAVYQCIACGYEEVI